MSVRSSGSRDSGGYKELRLPNSRAVKALIYFWYISSLGFPPLLHSRRQTQGTLQGI